ncbi:MAG: response regulator [Lachnospiraceae bacterium]|nr:response regulator [Lachnospiraceae bacterium]
MDDSRYRVIIAEDEQLIAKNIAKHIEAENPHFVVAGIYSNGEDALAAAKDYPPAAVFTDISMPVMTGLELAAELHRTMEHVKVVIITGYAEFEYAKEALHYGVEDYLLKPLDPAELRKVLKNLELSFDSIKKNARTKGGSETLPPEDIVRLVKDHIKAHYSEDLDLNSIADDLGFSSSYLTKIFNRYENIPPAKYIRNHRMGIAKQLLADRSLTIQQVALSVGYNDPFHFSKSFKQTFGITPTEYRSAMQNV